MSLPLVRFLTSSATTNKPFTMYIFVGLIYLAFSSIITLTVMGAEKYGKRTTEGAR